MATGFSVGSTCYATQAEAVDAHYSTQSPVLLGLDSTTYIREFFSKTGSVWNTNHQVLNLTTGNLNSSTVSVAPLNVVGSCTTLSSPIENFKDGVQLGWAVAAAMVIVYVIRRPYR